MVPRTRFRPDTRLDPGGQHVERSHLVDQALVLFGAVDDVYAEVERRRPGALVGDDVFVALRHASGVRSHLWMSHLAAQPGPRMRVLGTGAAYVKWGLDPQENALRAGGRPGDAGWGQEPRRERWGVLGAGEEADPHVLATPAYAHRHRRKQGGVS